MQLSVGLESIGSYKRLSYTTWHALAEFVDNSTQAYFDNRDVLDAVYADEGSRLLVSILSDRDAGTLTIKDNSIGMSLEELDAALKVAAKAPRLGSRSVYGMGLKTAACWFGDKWSIKTKNFGETASYTITVDVPTVAGGNGELKPVTNSEPSERHYTEITIEKLHRRIHGRAIRTIKDYLTSIYRCDLSDGTLELLFQGEQLFWDSFESRILRDQSDNPYRQDLDFDVTGKTVTGWVAVLESGGRQYGGFSILQNRRVIKGYPSAWKPRRLFGQEDGSNDLVNQRLCGELYLDGFEVSHTKDDIIWEEDQEEVIDQLLFEACKYYRQVALRRRKGDRRGPSQLAIDNAINQVNRELTSGEMVDVIQLVDIPPEAVLRRSNVLSVEFAARRDPRLDVQVGDLRVKFYMSQDSSVNDPYYALDLKPDGTIEIAVNQNHDYMIQLGNNIADFIRQCIYDGIAEYKATQKRGRVEPDTIRYFKDQLLRVPYQIHDDAEEFDIDE